MPPLAQPLIILLKEYKLSINIFVVMLLDVYMIITLKKVKKIEGIYEYHNIC